MKSRQYYLNYQAELAGSPPARRAERLGFQKLATLIDRFAPRAESCILDVGCGGGFLAHFLDLRSHTLFGLELNPELATVASRQYRGVVVADLEDPWPLVSERVDVVVARAVLEHVFDYHDVLNEANRVLTPGGLLLVEVPNLGYWREVRKLLLGKQPHWTRAMEHLHAWTERFLRALLQAHGFRCVWVECDRLGLPFFRQRPWPWLERVCARWGNTLIFAGRKDEHTRVVEAQLARMYRKTRPLSSRWVEVLE